MKRLILFVITLLIALSCDKEPTSSIDDVPETGSVTDIDGNVYLTVKIGEQWWMAMNLKVSHYRNGDSINNVIDDSDWENEDSGAYCIYDNNQMYIPTYGRLYNWFAVEDSRQIAPSGWHVPSDEEWQTLVDYLGGSTVAGNKLKESGTNHWSNSNEGATNSSGFTALPGGHRQYYGTFTGLRYIAHFWSSTDGLTGSGYYRGVYLTSEVHRGKAYKPYGFSVRCVKDN